MANIWDVLGGGLNLASGYFTGKAREKAADQQIDAARSGIASSAAQYRPYTDLGTQSANTLASKLTDADLLRDFGEADFYADPGYQFRLDEGLRAQRMKENAGGGLYSTAALRAAERYGQGLASDEYGAAYDRFNNNRILKNNLLTGGINAGLAGNQNYLPYYAGMGDARSAATVGRSQDMWGGVLGAYSALDEDRYTKAIRESQAAMYAGGNIPTMYVMRP